MSADQPVKRQQPSEPTKDEVLGLIRSLANDPPFRTGNRPKARPHALLCYLLEIHFGDGIKEKTAKIVRDFYKKELDGGKSRARKKWSGSREDKCLGFLRRILIDFNNDPKFPFTITVTIGIEDEPLRLKIEPKTDYTPAAFTAAKEIAREPDFHSPPPKHPTSHGLPAPGLFIRDEDEFSTIRAQWRADRNRPVLIWGKPGIGKSKLALALLQHPEINKEFGTRRYLLRCDGMKSAAEMKLDMGLEWFGLSPQPSTDGRPIELRRIEREIMARLSVAKAACVIDNFEAPYRKDPVVCEEWLKMLLGIDGVWLIVTVQGYYQPGGIHWSKPIEPTLLSLELARDLFCAITNHESHRKDPRLTGLLEDMSGVPHAIELLAHQAVNTDDLGPLLARWAESGTPMLERMGGRSPEHSLPVAYKVAIEDNILIDDGARRLLRVLACLPKGVHRSDVSEISKTVGKTTPLAAADMLERAALAYSDSKRLRLLAPLRDYVLRTYKATAEESELVRSYFGDIASAVTLFAGYDDIGVIEKVSEEFPNVEWAIENGLGARDGSSIYAACGMVSFSLMTGLKGQDFLPQAQNLAFEIGERQAEADCLFATAERENQEEAPEEARLGYQNALNIYRDLGFSLGEAHCLLRLGEIASIFGAPDQARGLILQALEAYLLCDAPFAERGSALCQLSLAEDAAERNDYTEATDRAVTAFAAFADLGYHAGEAACLALFGQLSRWSRKYDEARKHFKDALSLFHSLGIAGGASQSLLNLAALERECKQYGAAADYYQQALDLRCGDDKAIATCLYYLAEAELLASYPNAALAHLLEAIDLFKSVHDQLGEARCFMAAGIIAFQTLDNVHAAKFLQIALSMLAPLAAVEEASECWFYLGCLGTRHNDLDRGQECLETALSGFRSLSNQAGESKCIAALAEITSRKPHSD